MNKKITFGTYEAVCLLTFIINIQVLIGYPRYITKDAGTAGWILSILICLFALLIFFIISKLFSRFPGKDIIDISYDVCGNLGKIIICLIFSLPFIFSVGIVLRILSENVKLVSLPLSPLSFVMMFFITSAIFVSFLGPEILARLSCLFLPAIVIGYALLLLMASPNIDSNNFFPILGNGLPEIFSSSLVRVSAYFGLLIIYLFPPFIKSPKLFKSIGYISIIFSGIVMTSVLLVYTGIFPYPTSLEPTLPMYSLSRVINIGTFFRRIDPLFMLIWATSSFLYLGIALYFMTHFFARGFNLKYSNPLILPFAILTYCVAFIPDNLILSVIIEDSIIRVFGAGLVFIPPIILLLIAKFRGLGVKPGK